MAISLPDARELSDEILEALRLRALRGCELGFTQTEIADLLGVRRETVCPWWSAYADGGLDAVPHERSGRPVGSAVLCRTKRGPYPTTTTHAPNAPELNADE